MLPLDPSRRPRIFDDAAVLAGRLLLVRDWAQYGRGVGEYGCASVSAAVPQGSSAVLERADDLLMLDETLAAVRASAEGSLVLVAGEAGVGKTALIRAFCDSQAASVRVLWGACEPLLTPRPHAGP